jgi:hypothetical protein
MVGFGPPVVTGRPVAVGEFGRQAAVHQGLEALVHRGEGDPRDLDTDLLEDLVGVRMGGGSVKNTIDCRTLFRVPVPGGLEGTPEASVDGFRCEPHGISRPPGTSERWHGLSEKLRNPLH